MKKKTKKQIRLNDKWIEERLSLCREATKDVNRFNKWASALYKITVRPIL